MADALDATLAPFVRTAAAKTVLAAVKRLRAI